MVGGDDLIKLSLPSGPLTEQSVRDLAMMANDQRQILLGRWASNWARAKTAQRYELVLEWFERIRLHPLVKKGFKAIIGQDKEFVLNELGSFKRQMASYARYAGFMRFLLDEAETERLDSIAEIQRARQRKTVGEADYAYK